MQDHSLRSPSFYRKSSGVITIVGQGISAKITRGALELTSGWPLEGLQETHRLSRATHKIERLVCLAGSGWFSLAVLDYLRENDIPFLGLGQDGSLKWLTLFGPGGAWQAKLRMAQSLAPWSPVGLQIAKWLIVEKVRRHASLLRENAPSMARVGATSAAAAAVKLLQVFTHVEQAESIQQIRSIESMLAEVAWSGWIGLVVRLRPPSFAATIPPHVTRFTARHSPLSGTPQHAVSIPSALVNLAHSLVLVECAISAHSHGIDAHLPLIHSLRDARPSMLLDLAEPIYPISERLVLDLLLTREFRRGEFYVLRSGVVRLDQDFVAELLPRWIPPIRLSVAPIVERIASWLRRARIASQDHPAHKAGRPRHEDRTPVIRAVCPECGSFVRPGRRFCSAACYQVWWRANVQRRISVQGNETLARLRAEGQDPAHTPEVTQRRVASYIMTRRRQALAVPVDGQREALNRALQAAFRDAKQRLSVPALAKALRLSPHTTRSLVYHDDYRAGQHLARRIADRCAELLPSDAAPVPADLLRRLRRAADAIAAHPPRIPTDSRGRFLMGWSNRGRA